MLYKNIHVGYFVLKLHKHTLGTSEIYYLVKMAFYHPFKYVLVIKDLRDKIDYRGPLID